jgi:hypothetical protein
MIKKKKYQNNFLPYREKATSKKKKIALIKIQIK